MVRSNLVKSVCVAIALSGFSAPPAGAMEMVQGSGPGAGLYDGWISKAVVVHRGATFRGPGGGVYHRGMTYGHAPYRGGVYRGGAYGYHGGAYRYGGWTRPGYRWGPGGAIAAGAAIGVLAAGAAIAYAGQPPAPGLCWYYTDPGYRAGFWDACQ
jgi:hypothetical protein